MMTNNKSNQNVVSGSIEDARLKSRRRLLAGFTATMAAGVPALALGALPVSLVQTRTREIIDHAVNHGFPDVMVTSHTGERFRFYRDLVKGRLVLINFMSIRGEPEFPITRNVASLVHALGDRVGGELSVLSISYDEAHDSPERLAEFAHGFDAPRGWHFLSAEAEDVVRMSYCLYRTQGRPSRVMDSDLIHYGNDAAGLWGTLSAQVSDVDFAVTRISSVFPGPTPPRRLRRAGPRRIDSGSPDFHHRDPIFKT